MRKHVAAMALALTLAVASSALAADLAVVNPSFSGFSTVGWTGFGSYGAYAGNYGNNAADNLPADGSAAFLRYDTSYLKQTLSEVIDATKIYTATVHAATANDAWGSGVGVQLYAWNGTTETPITKEWVPGYTSWVSLSVQVSGSELAPYAGQTLGIKLMGGNGDRSNFDNVSVTKNDVIGTGYHAATAVAVPDYSFETSGAVNGSWAGGSPHVWNGSGWPMNSGSYGQTATNGTRVGVQASYQLINATFVEGARYTLTVDASLRGDQGPNPFVDAAGLTFFREDQFPGVNTFANTPTIGTLDGKLSTAINPNGLNGTGDWTTVTLTYVATAADAGQRIGIMLNNQTPKASWPQTVWDNVRLTEELPITAAPVPEPAGLGLIGVALLALRKRRS